MDERDEQMARLVSTLCTRLAEVLPRNQFEVTIEHSDAIRIRGLGNRHGDTMWLTLGAVWRAQLPAEERLEILFRTVSRRVQSFVSRRNRPWPTKEARPGVLINEEKILVWWGGPCVTGAAVALRPILRRDIGI